MISTSTTKSGPHVLMSLSPASPIILTLKLNMGANTHVKFKLIDSDPEGRWHFLTGLLVRLRVGAVSTLQEDPEDPAVVSVVGQWRLE